MGVCKCRDQGLCAQVRDRFSPVLFRQGIAGEFDGPVFLNQVLAHRVGCIAGDDRSFKNFHPGSPLFFVLVSLLSVYRDQYA